MVKCAACPPRSLPGSPLSSFRQVDYAKDVPAVPVLCVFRPVLKGLHFSLESAEGCRLFQDIILCLTDLLLGLRHSGVELAHVLTYEAYVHLYCLNLGSKGGLASSDCRHHLHKPQWPRVS